MPILYVSFILPLPSKAVATELKKEDFPAPVSPIIMILIYGTSNVTEPEHSSNKWVYLSTAYKIRETSFISFYIMNIAIIKITVLKGKKNCMYVA